MTQTQLPTHKPTIPDDILLPTTIITPGKEVTLFLNSFSPYSNCAYRHGFVLITPPKEMSVCDLIDKTFFYDDQEHRKMMEESIYECEYQEHNLLLITALGGDWSYLSVEDILGLFDKPNSFHLVEERSYSIYVGPNTFANGE